MGWHGKVRFVSGAVLQTAIEGTWWRKEKKRREHDGVIDASQVYTREALARIIGRGVDWIHTRM